MIDNNDDRISQLNHETYRYSIINKHRIKENISFCKYVFDSRDHFDYSNSIFILIFTNLFLSNYYYKNIFINDFESNVFDNLNFSLYL